jgi:hypothetical protein
MMFQYKRWVDIIRFKKYYTTIDTYKLDIRRYILYKGTVTCVCVCFIGCGVFTVFRKERVHTTVLYSGSR